MKRRVFFQWARVVGPAVVVLGVLALIAYSRYLDYPTSESYYFQRVASDDEIIEAFMHFEKGREGIAECMLMDPLILAGPKIVPRLCQEVQNRNMPKRGYALMALGNIGDRAAISTLISIMSDPTEEDSIRSEAATALWMIEPKNPAILAVHGSQGAGPILRRTLDEFRRGEPSVFRRSFSDAWHRVKD